MKNVLILAHLAHAFPRIPSLAKYLPEFGWQPIIITPPFDKSIDSGCRIIQTGYRDSLGIWKKLLGLDPEDEDDIRKEVKNRLGVTSKRSMVDSLLTLGGAMINYPDANKGWKPFAVKETDELLKKERISAVISSSSPIISHIIAKGIAEEYKMPWIADLRDLWTQNHNYGYGPLRKSIDRRLEIKTLSKAEVLVTVSQPWAKKLSALHKGKSTYTITNGFDPEYASIVPTDLTSKFTITYTGNIYTGKQDPSKLFAALEDLISEGEIDPKDIEVRFYGPMNPWLDDEAGQYGLSGIVQQYGKVPHLTALEKQRESQLLLHLTWEGLGETAGYSLKLFEYLAARRPILATGLGNDMTKEFLDETRSGIYAPTVKDIEYALRDLYFEYKNKGRICFHGTEEKINKYSYRELAGKLSEILDCISR